jgi:nicotinamide riboside kinase
VKIGITGTHSTGKTTLLHALRSEPEFHGFEVCDEVTRWVKSLGVNINEAGSDLSQELVMMKHVYNLYMFEDMLTDRTVLDGLVYTRALHMSKKVSDKTMKDVHNTFAKCIGEYDFLFYITPEFDIADDGVRSTNKEWQIAVEQIFEDSISAFNIPVIRITGSVRQRVEQVLKHINKSLGVTNE